MCFVCLTAYSPSCGNVTRSYLSVRWKRKKKKKTRKTIREYGIVIVVEVFLELHLRDRQHTVNTHNSRNLLNMIVQHFPAYNTPVLGLWNKNRCLFFHRHSLSAYSLFLSRLPFGQKKNGATVSVISSFPAIESGKFQLPMKFSSTLPMAFDPVHF